MDNYNIVMSFAAVLCKNSAIVHVFLSILKPLFHLPPRPIPLVVVLGHSASALASCIELALGIHFQFGE